MHEAVGLGAEVDEAAVLLNALLLVTRPGGCGEGVGCFVGVKKKSRPIGRKSVRREDPWAPGTCRRRGRPRRRGARGAAGARGRGRTCRGDIRDVGSRPASPVRGDPGRPARPRPRARRAHHQNHLHPRAPAVAGGSAKRRKGVGSSAAAMRPRDFFPGFIRSANASGGEERVSDATHHFALVLVADGDVGVLHGHVLLHELALRLGLVGSLGGGTVTAATTTARRALTDLAEPKRACG